MDVYQTNYGNQVLKWPYEIKYGKVNRIKTDVLVIGAGLSGAMAGIAAAYAGASVAVVDKAPIARSGNGGAGIDHWLNCLSNPSSPMTAEEFVEGYDVPLVSQDHNSYIGIKENYDVLMLLEKLGLPVRDLEGEFKDAPFYDEATKIIFAYDYKNRIDVRLRGGDRLKVVMNEGLKKNENVTRYERIMINSLLTEGGKQGARVIGAIGFSMETGEIFVFSAKAVVVTTGCPSGMWIFNTELVGGAAEFSDPNCVGDGLAMAWQAGAKITGMSKAGNVFGGGAFAWPVYGVGNCDNTWFPCSLVDANGKPVPWEDINGNPVETVEARGLPVDGQPFISTSFTRYSNIAKPRIARDFHERIKSGEFQLPLYAVLPSMPEYERRAIWGLMIGNEGKTRFAIHDHYREAGFNPDTDMLQCPMMDPESYGFGNFFGWYHGEFGVCKNWRDAGLFGGSGGPLVDWRSMTSLEGLFAAGLVLGSGGGASGASAGGGYAGRQAAKYAAEHDECEPDEAQIAAEIERIYAPVKRVGQPDAYVGWKELWAGTTRVMQCHCREYKTLISLQYGLDWLESIREQELQQTYARNPHELARVLECEQRLIVCEQFLIGCMSMIKAEDEGRGDGFVIDRLVDDKVETSYLPNKFWLEAPYEPTLLQNYEKYGALEYKKY